MLHRTIEVNIKYNIISEQIIGKESKTKYFQFTRTVFLTLNSPCLKAEEDFVEPADWITLKSIIFGMGITENVLVKDLLPTPESVPTECY